MTKYIIRFLKMIISIRNIAPKLKSNGWLVLILFHSVLQYWIKIDEIGFAKYCSHSRCAKQFGEVNGIGETVPEFGRGGYVTLFAGAMSWQAIGNTHRILTSPDPEKRVRVLRERRSLSLSRAQLRWNIIRALSAESRIYFPAKINRSEPARLRLRRNIISGRRYLRARMAARKKLRIKRCVLHRPP